jgi:mercuric ion transport protein
MKAEKNKLGMLVTGGLAAILASACCSGPLLLVSVGLGGAWVSNLQVLEPLKPVFIGVALIAIIFAYLRIFRSATDCIPGEICALPQTRLTYKLIFGIVIVLILLTLSLPYFAHYFY